MDVSGQIHVPAALILEKEPRTDWVCPTACIDGLAERNMCCPLMVMEPLLSVGLSTAVLSVHREKHERAENKSQETLNTIHKPDASV